MSAPATAPAGNHAPTQPNGAYSPPEIAARIEAARATKVNLPVLQTLPLGGGGLAGAIGGKAAAIAEAKAALTFSGAYFRGVLCNVLVCRVVWLVMAVRGAAGKILAIILPIAAFVAVGFERAAASMFVFTLAMIVFLEAVVAGITAGAFVANLVPVTLGNIVGGSVFVALIYDVVYLRGSGPGTDV